MKLTKTLFEAWGIPIRLHISLLLLPIYFMSMQAGWMITLILLTVVPLGLILHELGHCRAAMQYGFKVKDIILTPIGGMARIDSFGMKPYQEAWMAIAGPLVSLVLALISGGLYRLFIDVPIPNALAGATFVSAFLAWHTSFNLVILLFNLIPAFPMDGGRILRALLGLKFPIVKATRIAMVISRVICVFFIFLGLFPNPIFEGGNPSLMFIGFAIFWLSGVEYKNARRMEKLQHLHKIAMENSVIISPPPFGGEENSAPLSKTDRH